MYTLMRSISLRELVTDQLPVLLTSLVIAELFYKFHSFLLEGAAFLATWYALDAGVRTIRKLMSKGVSRR